MAMACANWNELASFINALNDGHMVLTVEVTQTYDSKIIFRYYKQITLATR